MNPPPGFELSEQGAYLQFLQKRDFVHFICTKIIETSTWTPALYRGVMIDSKGHAHYVKIPEIVYLQIPKEMKSHSSSNTFSIGVNGDVSCRMRTSYQETLE
jgi:hypothetical protein